MRSCVPGVPEDAGVVSLSVKKTVPLQTRWKPDAWAGGEGSREEHALEPA